MIVCGGGCEWDRVSDWDQCQYAYQTECEDAVAYDGSVSLSMLELPGRGLAIAGGTNMTATWSIQRFRRAHACGCPG